MYSGADWVERAARLPIAFAQVREDAQLDVDVVGTVPAPARVLMVASGGCTAAALAGSSKVRSIHLVDPNPAQIALARLKLLLLAREEPASRITVLGHASMPADERSKQLSMLLSELRLAPDVLGDPARIAEIGPDFAGRYEHLFMALSASLAPERDELMAMLKHSAPLERAARLMSQAPLGRVLDASLAEVMALANLVRLFGSEATRNPVQPFDRHFAERIRHAVATLPTTDNPYLWQMLLGRYPEAAGAPWLELPQTPLPAVSWEIGFMVSALSSRKQEFDFVHLSNILDWLTPEAATDTLERAWRTLAPGGCVLIRQLNSSLDIARLGPQFHWDRVTGDALHRRDRSFFYRALHLGYRR